MSNNIYLTKILACKKDEKSKTKSFFWFKYAYLNLFVIHRMQRGIVNKASLKSLSNYFPVTEIIKQSQTVQLFLKTIHFW